MRSSGDLGGVWAEAWVEAWAGGWVESLASCVLLKEALTNRVTECITLRMFNKLYPPLDIPTPLRLS